jgi:hypothetical protein
MMNIPKFITAAEGLTILSLLWLMVGTLPAGRRNRAGEMRTDPRYLDVHRSW